MKRDIAASVKAAIARQVHGDSDFAAHWKRLDDCLGINANRERFSDEETGKNLMQELFRHLIVSMVSLVQATLRTLFAIAIDHSEATGKPLAELKDVKITLELVREIKNQAFSVGQLLAHVLPVSGVEAIQSSLGYALNMTLKDFLGEDAKEDTIQTLVRLFEERNILCHELGAGMTWTPDFINQRMMAVYEILITSERFVHAIRHPNSRTDLQSVAENPS